MPLMTDRASISDMRMLPNGQMSVSARVARGGNVQDYAGRELGMPDRAVIRLYRPADEVFDKASMATFPHKLVTLDHPGIPASFDKDGQGWIGDEVARDGEFIRVPMIVAGDAAIAAINGGTRELSVGYTMEIVFEDGKTPEGAPFDAKMSKIVVDHVAIVDRARGGPELRIGDWRVVDSFTPALDHNPGGRNMPDTRKVVVDGLTIETTEQGAQVIERLTRQLGDAQSATVAANDAHAAAIKAKDTELARKDAEIDGLKGKVLDAGALDKLVQARGDLISKAKLVADADYTGKADADIRKAAVVAKLGDAAIAGKVDAYIEARFDILVSDAMAADPVRTALITGDGGRRAPSDNGQAEREARLTAAWEHKA